MAKYDPDKHHRGSTRLKGYDYAQAGAYFVTICTYNRECLFGEIVDAKMRLNEYGQIVTACWDENPGHFPNLEMDAFVVMPNHVHGIFVITSIAGATHASPLQNAWSPSDASLSTASHPQRPQQPRGPQSRSVAAIVGSFKSAATKRINDCRDTRGASVWQRGYHEHIVRNERDLNRIREYIANNPANWLKDPDNLEVSHS